MVTLPIGVLKASAGKRGGSASVVLFDPPLPNQKMRSLEWIGESSFTSVAVLWGRKCWSDRHGAYYVIGCENESKEGDSDNLENPLCGGFVNVGKLRGDPTSRQTQHYLNADWLPTIENDDRTSLSSSKQGSVFVPDDAYWRDRAVRSMNTIFPNENVTSDDVVSVAYTDWLSDPFSLGSYSSSKAAILGPLSSSGGYEDQDDRSILAETVGRTLYFAGEHTNVNGRHQSLDGAYDSGIQAAGQVADYYILSTRREARRGGFVHANPALIM